MVRCSRILRTCPLDPRALMAFLPCYQGDYNTVKKRITLLCLSTVSVLLLSGCNMVILNPKGMIAADEKFYLITALLLMFTIVIPVIILTFVIARKYRASNVDAKYTPEWAHSNLLEAVWWAVPMVIILILGIITWVSTHKLDPYRPLVSKTKPVTIEVVALEWRWLFIYPEQHIATVNFIEFPVNTPVAFKITADAPMNSFQIPALGGQIYAMAGMQTKLHLITDQPGDYKGRSVSFSGAGFTNMKFIARATSKEDFDKWVKTVQQSNNPLNWTVYNELAKPSKVEKVQYYSSVTDNLYGKVMMKFMKPTAGDHANAQG